MTNKIIDQLTWEGNSKMMYERVLESVPKLLQGAIVKIVTQWVQKHDIKVITEEVVFQMVDDVAPSDIKAKLVPYLENMKTNK